jgi:hypothetical protein
MHNDLEEFANGKNTQHAKRTVISRQCNHKGWAQSLDRHADRDVGVCPMQRGAWEIVLAQHWILGPMFSTNSLNVARDVIQNLRRR